MDSTTMEKKRVDVYQVVTDRVISLLETGVVPWKKTWTGDDIPRNLLSKRAYRGINFWLLLSLNYEQNYFLTWDQVRDMGGRVNAGEKGHIVVFWKNVPKSPEEKDEEGRPKTIPMLRYYKVFNIAQCSNIKPELLPAYTPVIEEEADVLLSCEEVIASMPLCPKIQHKEQSAYYHPLHDFVNMPKKKSFSSVETYYSTLFHELVHSTGHEKRLNRKSVGHMQEFNPTEAYSFEELVAEIGAAFLCNKAGILEPVIDNTASYIDGWLKPLKNDKRFIIQAAAQGQKAADYVLNLLEDESFDVKETTTASVVS